MSKTLDQILNLLITMCDKEVIQSDEFGLEFGTYSQKVTKATNIKSITVSTFTNLRLLHAMHEEKSNLVITILPLSIIENGFPLSERDFELLKSLVNNNIKTISLSKEWLYSQNGAFTYFLQTLGINKFEIEKISSIQGFKLYQWVPKEISFKDFLASLSHLTKRWSAFRFSAEDKPIKFIIEKQPLSKNELSLLRKEGINTVISFNLDSTKLNDYQNNKMNYLFIPLQDFCDISLRKFAQLLQMKVEQKVIFHPQEVAVWISSNNFAN